MELIPLLSAAGIGGIVSALVTSLINGWLNGRNQRLSFEHQQKQDEAKRNFDEQKEAYIGLLEAYHKAAVEGTDKAAKEFAYWQMRCELVASSAVRHAIQRIVDTNDDVKARRLAHEHLKSVLRKALGVSNSS